MDRVCRKCGETKDISKFRKSKDCLHGRSHKCHTCANSKRKKYEYTPEMNDKARKRDLLRRYGVTPEHYNQMFVDQDGRCAICQRHQGELPKALFVDHCHSTGTVRGLLCMRCNTALGMLEDNEDSILNMLEYIAKSKPKPKK